MKYRGHRDIWFAHYISLLYDWRVLRMVRYLGGKLINIVFSLLILATATFFLMKAGRCEPYFTTKKRLFHRKLRLTF